MKKENKKIKKADEESAKKQEILNIYCTLIENGSFFPTRADLKQRGISRDLMRYYFSNLSNLRLAAKEYRPDVFEGNINLEDYISDEYLEDLSKEIKKNNRFVITTAVSGQTLHRGFMDSINIFCKLNNAKLLILPSHDPAHNLDNEIDWHFDPSIIDERFVFEEIRINSNLFISGIRVTAKQINPITGLNELSQTKGSFISASPKQFLEYDAVSANKLPHARMTTGACTLPNYSSSKGNSLRTSYIATFQHMIGALIVEKEDDNIYYPTQIQADADGNFCHHGYEYNKKGARKLVGDEAPILVMGDYHAGEHDEKAVSALIDMIDAMGIQEAIAHDMFNGVSINPHEEDDIMLRAERARKGLNVLENELITTSNEIDRLLNRKSMKKLVIVKSNHDDFIDRYLRKGKYVKDPVNYELCSLISADIISASRKGIRKDFFKTGLELTRNPKNTNKIKWLTVDEDYIIGGIHLGAHGDKSANGAKGSIKGLAKCYPKCVVGHSHTPGIFKGAFQVGTTSLLRLGYNKGSSSWVHCSCLVYKNGQRQLVNSINGKWKIKNKK